MGQYRSAVITDAGQALLADAISGSGTVTFSAVKTSSYAYPQGTNIAGLTDLQDIVQTVTPFSAQVFNDTMLQVSARFDNSGVASAYLIQTLGAYAQIGDNDPVLFAVVQANTPDQMPMQSPVSPSAFIYNIQITVQQASQITVTVNPAGTATVQDILTLSAQKVDVNGGELAETETIFDDSGSVSGITSFPAFLATFLSKTKTGIFLRNLKAGLQFVLHVGSIVNNCVTDNAELPLSAAQGKVLMDLYTVLNTKALNAENQLNNIGARYNANFTNKTAGGASDVTLASLNVPAGTYVALFFARTDSENNSRYLLKVNDTVCGYVAAGGSYVGMGCLGGYILTLNASGTIYGEIHGENNVPSLGGWMGFLQAVRIK